MPLPQDSEPDGKVELVGYAPVPSERPDQTANGRHGFVALVSRPTGLAFATIYKNQSRTLVILAAAIVSDGHLRLGCSAAGSFDPCWRSSRSPVNFSRGTSTTTRTSNGATSWGTWPARSTRWSIAFRRSSARSGR